LNRTDGKLSRLLRAVISCRLCLSGAVLFVLVSPLLFISALLDLQGGIENPYFSLLIYLLLGPLAVIAIALMAAGRFSAKDKDKKPLLDYENLKEQLTIPEHYNRIRRWVYFGTGFALFFLFLLCIAAYSGHRYTESAAFCGNFCHTVMKPEFVSHQNSPHSRIRCVDCHNSTDVNGLTAAKLTGMKQLYATLLDTYPRPLKTPMDNLRPSRGTCEECHRPEKFHGHRLYFLDIFLPDERNTHLQTAMILKVGSGGYLGRSAQGIHWHTSEQHQIFYTATDTERREISRMILFDADGTETVFSRQGAAAPTGGAERLMDCIDCHNRPTHDFLPPETALDQKLLNRQIPTELPYIKRQALAAITRNYQTKEKAVAGIAEELQRWYEANLGTLIAARPWLLTQAIKGAQQAYAENVFPEMNIFWETYPDFIGHRHGNGCFRCHDGAFQSPAGRVISRDCNLCHIILAENEPADKVLEIITGSRQDEHP
jgi:hypothetical protein